MSSEKKEKKQHKMNFNIKEKLKKTFSKEHLKEVFTGEEQKKHLKQGSYSSIMTVIVLAVIVVINLIVAQIPTSKTQIDLSTQKMYSITDETKTASADNNAGNRSLQQFRWSVSRRSSPVWNPDSAYPFRYSW